MAVLGEKDLKKYSIIPRVQKRLWRKLWSIFGHFLPNKFFKFYPIKFWSTLKKSWPFGTPQNVFLKKKTMEKFLQFLGLTSPELLLLLSK